MTVRAQCGQGAQKLGRGGGVPWGVASDTCHGARGSLCLPVLHPISGSATTMLCGLGLLTCLLRAYFQSCEVRGPDVLEALLA